MKERSLVGFTLLSQMALGTLWWLSVLNELEPMRLLFLTTIMVMALGAAFFHLGTPRRAWHAMSGWRSSWLSREVLCATSFTVLLGGVTLAASLNLDLRATGWLANLCGLALLISMTQVYQLRTVPEWHRRTTTASFFSATLLLGSVCSGALSGGGPWLALAAIGLVGVRQVIGWSAPRLLLLRALTVIALLSTLFISGGWWVALALSLSTEALARSAFYADRAHLSAWRFSTW